MVRPQGQGVVEPVRTVCRQGGVNFSRFCADVFYGRPLIKLKKLVQVFPFLFKKIARIQTQIWSTK